MIECPPPSDRVEGRQFIRVDGDAQLLVPNVVLRELPVEMVDAKQHQGVPSCGQATRTVPLIPFDHHRNHASSPCNSTSNSSACSIRGNFST